MNLHVVPHVHVNVMFLLLKAVCLQLIKNVCLKEPYRNMINI